MRRLHHIVLSPYARKVRLALAEKRRSQSPQQVQTAPTGRRMLPAPGAGRRLVLVSDGLETRGDLEAAAREAALKRIVVDVVPNRGPAQPDARVVRLRSSRSRSHATSSSALPVSVKRLSASRRSSSLIVKQSNSAGVSRRPAKIRPRVG